MVSWTNFSFFASSCSSFSSSFFFSSILLRTSYYTISDHTASYDTTIVYDYATLHYSTLHYIILHCSIAPSSPGGPPPPPRRRRPAGPAAGGHVCNGVTAMVGYCHHYHDGYYHHCDNCTVSLFWDLLEALLLLGPVPVDLAELLVLDLALDAQIL